MSCTKLQLPPEPLTRGLPPPDPRSLCPLSSTEFVEPPPRTKFMGTPLLLEQCGGTVVTHVALGQPPPLELCFFSLCQYNYKQSSTIHSFVIPGIENGPV